MDNPIMTLKDFFGTVKLSQTNLNVTDAEGNATPLAEIFRKFPTMSQSYFAETMEKHLSDFLNLDISEILSNTWDKAEELQEYFDKEKYPANKEIIVPLIKHKAKSEHAPYVEITLNNAPICQVKFEIELELELEGVILKIQAAQIQEARLSSCKGKGEIKCEAVKIAEKELQKINLPGVMRFTKAKTAEAVATAATASSLSPSSSLTAN